MKHAIIHEDKDMDGEPELDENGQPIHAIVHDGEAPDDNFDKELDACMISLCIKLPRA